MLPFENKGLVLIHGVYLIVLGIILVPFSYPLARLPRPPAPPDPF